MLFVFDTNTIVSAILKPISIPAQAVAVACQKGQLVFSEETKSEFLEVIGRSKFDKYVPSAVRLRNAQYFIDQAAQEQVGPGEKLFCKDASDVKFLRLALKAKVRFIVSGDMHLKELNPFYGIPIMSPADFLLLQDTI